jgi:hypothetical protein
MELLIKPFAMNALVGKVEAMLAAAANAGVESGAVQAAA